MTPPTDSEIEARLSRLEALAAESGDIPTPKPCPECGQDLTDIDIRAHQMKHWGDKCPHEVLYPVAAGRWKELEAMI